ISLFITSAFYFLNQFEHTLFKKMFIIGCLTMSTIILSYLYLVFEDSVDKIKILLFIETVSNSILLMPSGMLDSPFIWYTLNTILISSLALKKMYLWINIFLYTIIIGILSYLYNNCGLEILNSLKEKSGLLLSIAIIVALVRMLSAYIKQTEDNNKKLRKANTKLQSANQKVTESFEHIKILYQSLNILSSKGNMDGLINTLFDYVKKITKTNLVFYYDMSDSPHKIISRDIKKAVDLIKNEISDKLNDILESKAVNKICVSDTEYAIILIGNCYPHYGILGFEIKNTEGESLYNDNIYQIQYLSQLFSIAFEKIELEEMNERLIISKEQNRIANEIHDSVFQRLFSMSCGIFALMKKIPNLSVNKVIDELEQFREIIDIVMKDLRDKIYGLSWKKSGQNVFITDTKGYIEDIKKFYDANIPFTIIGNVELLTCNQKKALYRVICEGIGNAVRHGKAKNIDVDLDINAEFTNLSIRDDGMGFEVPSSDNNRSGGLGIQNMYQLADSLKGHIEIKSTLGIGTSVELVIPNNDSALNREVV
ncbi:MAG TPA: ATP-binding protein, partial [Oscillospiraceae bacterium]|nr:ATP-binding protein [Oscillospiraceae bacterium]